MYIFYKVFTAKLRFSLEKEKKRNKKGFLLQVIAIFLDSASLRSRLKAARNDGGVCRHCEPAKQSSIRILYRK